MKIAWVLVLIIVLFTASCAPKYVCPDRSVVADPSLCPTAKEEAAPLKDAQVQEVLDKSKNIASMSYLYKRVDKPLEKSLQFWVRGITVKRELPVQTKVLNKNEMDAVIFNLVARTANGYCESKKYCIKTGDVGAVDYDTYYLKTPFDWREEITSAEKVAEEILFDRKTWQLKVDENTFYWVDTFSGLPLRVDVDGERHEFQNPVYNRVEDVDIGFVEREE